MSGRIHSMISLYKAMSEELSALSLSFDGVIYNPLDYARDNFAAFLEMSLEYTPKTAFLGMNPGPYGMTQTGVPFGDIEAVKGYLGINGQVGKPVVESGSKKITGMETTRREGSGKRFWTMAEAYGRKEEFFSVAAVLNYCPLCFIDGNTNITPDKLPSDDRKKLYPICDSYLQRALDIIMPSSVIAIGRFSEAALKRTWDGNTIFFPHPSPLNPSASAFWDSGDALKEFRRIVDAS